MSRLFLSFRLLAAVGATVILLGGPLLAQPVDEATSRSVKVSANGLDLGTPLGEATFRRRVASAAHRVCADEGDRSAAIGAEASACEARALDGAAPQLALIIARAGDDGMQVASR